MDERLKALVDAPLANPLRLNIPGGKEALPPKPRAVSEVKQHRPGDLTARQVRERKAAAEQQKLDALYNYYATTDVPAERVAEHIGVRKLVEDGTDDAGKMKYKSVLDVDTVRHALAVRRQALRAGE
jgi:hypothetical protein